MLYFCNSNIYLTNELSNDITSEAHTTDFPACSPEGDATGIYEGVVLHKFNASSIAGKAHEFFKYKQSVAFQKHELKQFVTDWYKDCVTKHRISNCVDIDVWFDDYIECYLRQYKLLENVIGNALGYFETLALYDLQNTDKTYTGAAFNLSKLNPQPEISWIISDYFKNKSAKWKTKVTEFINKNIYSMIFHKADIEKLGVKCFNLTLPLDIVSSPEEIDWKHEQALFYLCPPFGSGDFYTNYVYLKRLVDEHADNKVE